MLSQTILVSVGSIFVIFIAGFIFGSAVIYFTRQNKSNQNAIQDRLQENVESKYIQTTQELVKPVPKNLTPTSSQQSFNQIALLDKNNKPAIFIEEANIQNLKKSGKILRNIPIASLSNEISLVLNSLPNMGMNLVSQNGNLMHVVVNGKLHPGKVLGELSPVVRNTKGQIKEWARLQNPTMLKNAARLTAIWSIASLITAQKHLSDINAKLASLEKGIESIRNFLDAQRLSKITGTISYLKQIYPVISGGDLDSTFRNQLESREVELLTIQDHLFAEINQHIDSTQIITNPSKFGKIDEFVQKISEHGDKTGHLLNTWLLCARARSACWQVLSVYPGESSLKIGRKNDIESAIQRIEGVVNNGVIEFDCKISEIKGMFTSDEKIADCKNILKTKFDESMYSFNNEKKETMKMVSDLGKNLIEIEKKPLSLVLKLKNGVIVEALEVT